MELRQQRMMLAFAGACVAVAIMLGASLQHEEVLATVRGDSPEVKQDNSVLNVVPLTAVPFAFGMGLAAFAVMPQSNRRLAAVAVAIASYSILQILQTAWPNFTAFESTAHFSISLLASNGPGPASLWIPVMALWTTSMWIAVRSLGGSPLRHEAMDWGRTYERFAANAAAALPFLIIAVWGPLRLLLQLPAGDPAVSGQVTVVSVQVLAALGLIGVFTGQIIRLRTAALEPRLRAYSHEQWATLRWAQWAILGLYGLSTLAGFALPSPAEFQVFAGPTFGTTIPIHHLLSLFVVLPFIPVLLQTRQISLALADEATGPNDPPRQVLPHPALFLACAGLGLLGAGATALTLEGAMWPWVAATVAMLPVAWAAPRLGIPATSLAALSLWAMGNTITASYDADAGEPVFETVPGILALWRIAAVALGAIIVARAVVPRGTKGLGWGRAIIASFCLALVAILEFPLVAWTTTELGRTSVAIGTLPASQSPPIDIMLHAIAGIAVIVAFVMLAPWTKAKGSQ